MNCFFKVPPFKIQIEFLICIFEQILHCAVLFSTRHFYKPHSFRICYPTKKKEKLADYHTEAKPIKYFNTCLTAIKILIF